MNLFVVMTGFIELLLSLIVGIFFVYGAFLIFKWMTKDLNEIQELKKNNIAVGLFYGAVIFSICLIVKGAIEPAITALTSTIKNPDSTWLSYVFIAGIMLLQIILSGIFAFLSIYIAIRIFMALTKDIDEIAEIKQNNIAVAIILVTIILSIALFIEPGIKVMMDGLIPYPPSGNSIG